MGTATTAYGAGVMKVRKTVTMDKAVAELLDSNCIRHGDVTFHIENALRQYFKPIKPKPASKEIKPEVKCDADEVIDYLNMRAGTNYRHTKGSRDCTHKEEKSNEF